MIYGFTGHRPNRLGGYKAFHMHNRIMDHMRNFVDSRDDIDAIISGGALGIDQFIMRVGLGKKNSCYCGSAV